MVKQAIGIGTTADDGTGDTLRGGGDKINDNFDELYEMYCCLAVSICVRIIHSKCIC